MNILPLRTCYYCRYCSYPCRRRAFLLNLICRFYCTPTCENSRRRWNDKDINACHYSFVYSLIYVYFVFCAFTSKVQIIGGVDDNAHQGEVESSYLGPDLELDTAMVQVMGAQEAVDGIDGLSLDFPPVKTFSNLFFQPICFIKIKHRSNIYGAAAAKDRLLHTLLIPCLVQHWAQLAADQWGSAAA